MHKNQDTHTDTVFIRDLTLNMSVGIYDNERQDKQRVVINIAMAVPSNEGKRLNSINDVVSYEHVVLRIKDIADEQHFDLLETFAERIAEACLLDKNVLSVSVKVEKPDIFQECGAVGIEIIRQ
tara:strand:+ start:3471 stop:3842 length:372 start_codon:yes stop_codon:yes gene_type:complete